jgi:GH35 family endo-1,4-beta-xylanase
MTQTMVISLLYYCLLSSVSVGAQNPIGLRASSFLRGILFGSAVGVGFLRQNVDDGQYNASILTNYQLVVPENVLKPKSIWKGENQYYWVDADFLLGAPNSTALKKKVVDRTFLGVLSLGKTRNPQNGSA